MQVIKQSFAEIKLSQEEFDTIEKLAACNYTPQMIALYLDVDLNEFMRQYLVPESLIRHHYRKGLLESEYLISQKLLDNAKTGNISAVDTFEERQNKVNLRELKKRIFNDGY